MQLPLKPPVFRLGRMLVLSMRMRPEWPLWQKGSGSERLLGSLAPRLVAKAAGDETNPQRRPPRRLALLSRDWSAAGVALLLLLGGLFGGLLGASWDLWGPPGSFVGAYRWSRGPPWGDGLEMALRVSLLGPCWGRLGASLGLLGLSGAVLGRSGGPLGPSWTLVRPKS